MQLHAFNFELTGDELLALAVLPKNSEHFSLEAITLKRDEIQVKAAITGLGMTESRWLPVVDEGRLRLTLSQLKGGMVAGMMKKSLVVSLIAKAVGSHHGLSAAGDSLLIDAAPLLNRLGLKGRLTLQTVSCLPAGLRFALSGEAKLRKPAS